MPRLSRSDELKRGAGQRLRAAREALGLKQKDIYEAIGVADNTYSQWETGKALVDITAAIRIADIFGITTEWIYRGVVSGLPDRIMAKVLKAAS